MCVSLNGLPIQSPPFHFLSCVLSCYQRSSEVQTGILPPPLHRHCRQRWSSLTGVISAATAGIALYSSTGVPAEEKGILSSTTNHSMRSSKMQWRYIVPAAPEGRPGLQELWCMVLTWLVAGGLFRVHSTVWAKYTTRFSMKVMASKTNAFIYLKQNMKDTCDTCDKSVCMMELESWELRRRTS